MSGGHTLVANSSSITQHSILLETRDIAIGNCLDKVARALKVPWGDKMPGAALEEWSQINNCDDNTITSDIERWGLSVPLSVFKKNVLAYSFTGVRSAVERTLGNLEKSVSDANQDTTASPGESHHEEEKRSLARAAQAVAFEHVANKCALGIKYGGEYPKSGNIVVSGGVACNNAFRKM
jgi:N6-L-threonylcarbamoyladenine synthase